MLEFLDDLVAKAIMYCFKIQAVDKCGEPIYKHCERVGEFFRLGSLSSRRDKLCLIVGYLHDVVEEGVCDVTEIEVHFGREIAEAVDAISRREGESYSHYLDRCAEDPIARRVKVSDLRDNLNLCRLKSFPSLEDAKREKKYAESLIKLLKVIEEEKE